MFGWELTRPRDAIADAVVAIASLGVLMVGIAVGSPVVFTAAERFGNDFAIGFACWFVVLYPIMAVVEYVAHRWFMHRRSFINRFGFKAHAIEHHGHGLNDDWPHVRLRMRDHLKFGSPAFSWFALSGVLYLMHDWRGPFPSVVELPRYAFGGLAALLAWSFIHTRLYSLIHRTHHDLDHNWTERLPGAVAMRRHHLIHHDQPRTNFSVVLGCPWFWVDRLFGTHQTRFRNDPIL